MEGGNKKVDSKKKGNFFTYPFISDGNLKHVTLTGIQFNILKYISQKVSTYYIARYLNCTAPNIRYHLNKLGMYNLVSRPSENCIWNITNEGLQVLKGWKERRLTKKIKVDSKGLLLEKRVPIHEGLTKKEQHIYNLIVNKHYKPLQVALELNCSKQNVYKILKKIREKGYLGGGNKKVDFLGVRSQPLSPSFISPLHRLHNMRWTIRLFKKIENFKGLESVVLDRNKIKVWESVIEIYSKKDFWGKTPQESFDKAMEYWYQFFVKLENKLKITFVKEKETNIELTRCEFANAQNEIAKDYLKRGKKLNVYTKDGELWALIDNSHNLFEFETVRSKSAKPDMERIMNVLNDYRDNPDVMCPKELQKKIEYIVELITNSAMMQNNIFKCLEVITEEIKKEKTLNKRFEVF